MVITVCVLTGVETMGTIVPVLMAVVVVTELAMVSVNRKLSIYNPHKNNQAGCEKMVRP